MLRAMLVAGLLFGALPAAAQESDPKPCKKPVLRESFSVSAEQMQYLTEATQAYIDCMKPVIESKRDQAQKLMDQAKVAAEASNAAATEVNDFITAFRSFQAKHKDDK